MLLVEVKHGASEKKIPSNKPVFDVSTVSYKSVSDTTKLSESKIESVKIEEGEIISPYSARQTMNKLLQKKMTSSQVLGVMKYTSTNLALTR